MNFSVASQVTSIVFGSSAPSSVIPGNFEVLSQEANDIVRMMSRGGRGPIAELYDSAYRNMMADPDMVALPSTFDDALSGRKFPPCHYYAFTPSCAGESRKLVPVFLMLHGGMGHFRSYLYFMAKAAEATGFALVMPTFRGGEWWRGGVGFALAALQDALMRMEGIVDPDQVLIGGLSNGATGTWAVASEAFARPPTSGPRFRIAALVFWSGAMRPGASWRRPDGWPPCFFVHGDSDTVLRVKYSRDAYAVCSMADSRCVYKELPGQGHSTHPEDPEVGYEAVLRWYLDYIQETSS